MLEMEYAYRSIVSFLWVLILQPVYYHGSNNTSKWLAGYMSIVSMLFGLYFEFKAIGVL